MPQQYTKPMVMVCTWVLSLAVGTAGPVYARSLAAIQQSQEIRICLSPPSRGCSGATAGLP